MPKTLSPTQVLAENIERLEVAIADKERQLLQQQGENIEFSEALRLLSVGASPYIPTGQVKMIDVINGVLDEASNQSDREYRWSACQRALHLGQEAAESIDAELQELRQQLAIAQKVEALEADISARQAQLQHAQSWLSEPEGSRSYRPGNAWTEVEYLQATIPVLQQQLERLIAQPIARDEKFEASFRSYVRARTEVQPSLDVFLAAQEQYLDALAEFKQAIAANPIAAEFSSHALDLPRIVGESNGIRFV